MQSISEELVSRWQAALEAVVHLPLADAGPAAVRAADDDAWARADRGLSVRGPLAAVGAFLEASNELEWFLATQDPTDPAVGRARSVGAYADLEAAGDMLDLAVIANLGQHQQLRAVVRDRRRFDDLDIALLAETLRRAHTIRGGSPALLEWEPTLRTDLAVVAVDAARVLAALDATALAPHAADGIGPSLSTLLDDDVLEKLVNASAHAVGYLHRSGLALAHGATRKLAGLLDDDVRKALAAWFSRDLAEPPVDVISAAAGLDATIESWRSWSSNGAVLTEHLGALATSRDEHRTHLEWALRATGLVAFAYDVAAAAPPTVPYATFFGGVALVAVAGWALWSVCDHCHEVADLV